MSSIRDSAKKFMHLLPQDAAQTLGQTYILRYIGPSQFCHVIFCRLINQLLITVLVLSDF